MMATWEEQEAAHNEALDKIEQLEAEVESWKISYEREKAEKQELQRKVAGFHDVAEKMVDFLYPAILDKEG